MSRAVFFSIRAADQFPLHLDGVVHRQVVGHHVDAALAGHLNSSVVFHNAVHFNVFFPVSFNLHSQLHLILGMLVRRQFTDAKIARGCPKIEDS